MRKTIIILVSAVAILALSGCDILGTSSQTITGRSISSFDEGLVSPENYQAPGSGDSVDSTRYLILFKARPGNADRENVRNAGARIRREFSIVPAMSISVGNARALEALRNNPNVVAVEEDAQVFALDEVTPWGIDAVKAPQAWSTTTGSGVNIAVLDTGIDYTHPDLAANFKGGYDFVNDDSDPYDDNSHGTHCAGTIAAIAGNNIGVIGVAYNVNLYSVKVLDAEGSGYTSDILAGVDWAVQNNMDIVSMSLGGGRFSKTEEKAYQNTYNAGLLVIAASGNDAATTVSYPAAYATNVAVGATDIDDNIADFSNTGDAVEVVAPGVDVLSTVPMGTGTLSSLSVVSTGEELKVYHMDFAPLTDGIEAEAVYCGLGLTAEDFPAEVAGNIALIQRGDISFVDKVLNAKAAGASAAIIYNNVTGNFLGTLGAEGDYIPAVSLSMEDGEALVAMGSPVVHLSILPWDYAYYDGTSMATPHAAAVAALIKAANPDLTNVEIRTILDQTAVDLGAPGWDSIFGNGLVDAEAAVAMAGNAVFKTTDSFSGRLKMNESAEHNISVSGGVISLELSGSSNLELYLLAPDGSTVASNTSGITPLTLTYDADAAAGEYTIQVKNVSLRHKPETYTLTAEYVD